MADWNNCKAATGTKMGSVITLTSVNDFLRQLPRTQGKPRQQAIFVFLQQKQLASRKMPRCAKNAAVVARKADWRRQSARNRTLPFVFIDNFCVGTRKAKFMT
ncbi:MAG: hypothetical protein ACFN9G_13195 [Cardiobacterium sp.]